MNEDGHLSIPRRGYLAAGLAAIVIGSLGVVAQDAGAEESAAPPSFAHTGEDASTPPPLLPWGEKPTQVTKGPADVSSEQLAAMGVDIAPRRGPRAKRGPKGSAVAPRPPLAAPNPVAGKTVYFQYSAARQVTPNIGSFANVVVGRPTLDGKDYHTLAEIAVQSADRRQIVEVGWTVDRLVNGDDDPHLFVYHWVDNNEDPAEERCYNGCGFVQHSKTVFPGDMLVTGTAKRMGIKFADNAWWIAFDTEWVGYYPASQWGGRYTRADLVQWFGEVASSRKVPCSAMGTGRVATKDSQVAARFGTIKVLSTAAVGTAIRTTPVDKGQGINSLYPSARSSRTTFRFGGPSPCEK